MVTHFSLQHELSHLANFITHIRNKRGLSQGDVARKAGLARSYISRLEEGNYKSPTIMTLTRLAKGLGVSNETILSVAGVRVQQSKLPEPDVYFRTKYNLPEKAIEELERYLNYIKKEYVSRK